MTHDAHPASGTATQAHEAPPAVTIPAPPPDDENPAIIFARKTYLWTIVFSIAFIGSVLIFIL